MKGTSRRGRAFQDPRRERIRRGVNRGARLVIQGTGLLSILVLVGIFVLLTFNALQMFAGGIETKPLTADERRLLGPDATAALEANPSVPPTPADFLLNTRWRPDAVTTASYGVLAMVVSTLMTTVGAMILAVPIGMMAAAWLAFEAKGRIRGVVKFGVELVAAIPSVVVGFVGLRIVGPLLGEWFDRPGGLSALNGAVLLAVMALPTIISLSEDALTATPRGLMARSPSEPTGGKH